MVKYVGKIDHATSVQEIGIIGFPTPQMYGLADMRARPVFSVFDIGTIIPPVPLAHSTITLMKGFNFEMLKAHGVDSHYQCLVTDDGEEISAKDAIERGIAPTICRVKFVNRVKPNFIEGQGWDYSMFANPDNNNHVHPIEFISRNDLGKNSSVWRRVDDGELTLQDLGLPASFKRGDHIPENLKPILDYSTKFEPDDRYPPHSQIQGLLGINDARYAKINDSTRRASNIMTAHADSVGFKREDGKVEYITFYEYGEQKDELGDAVCTWHEDRLTRNGFGLSKQRIRDRVKQLNLKWYDEIQRAKKEAKSRGVADFRTLMNPSIQYVSPSPEFFNGVNTLFRAGTNQWVQAKVYPIFPEHNESLEDNLDRAMEEFQKLSN
jgi:phosphoribosylaminoimidazole-succinocarboxamide synthase